MAKLQSKSKTTSLQTDKGNGLQIDKTDHFDDTPLPDSEELARYSQIDPNIVTWLMRVTENEQAHRHQFDNKRILEVR